MEVGEKHLKIIHISEELYTQTGDAHAVIQKTCGIILGMGCSHEEGTNLRGKLPSH